MCSSDWHLDAVTSGVSRHEELKARVYELIEKAVELKVDAFLFTGDLCDPDTGSAVFRCMEVACHAAIYLAVHGIRSFWMAGNHDVIEDGSGETTLAPLKHLHELVQVIERPTLFSLVQDTLDMICLPFTAASYTYSPEAAFNSAMMVSRASGVIVAGHLNVPGIIPGSETHEMPRGRDVWLPIEHMHATMTQAVKPYLAINGHYHGAGPSRTDTPSPVHIPGSLARLTFGEEFHTPGYMLIDYEAPKRGAAKRFAVTYPKFKDSRQLVSLAGIGEDPALVRPESIVRVAVPASVEQREVDAFIATLKEHGAAVVRADRGARPHVVKQTKEPVAVKPPSIRGVITSMVEQANTKDRPALSGLVEKTLGKAGL